MRSCVRFFQVSFEDEDKDITLPDNSYHSPLRPLHMTAGSALGLFQSAIKSASTCAMCCEWC